MADPKGFLTTPRELPKRRPVDVRIKDWKEVYQEQEFADLQKQAGRCMDCGIPFCHQGCPLGNLIPEWNDLIWRGEKSDAIDRLHATNKHRPNAWQASYKSTNSRRMHICMRDPSNPNRQSCKNFSF